MEAAVVVTTGVAKPVDFLKSPSSCLFSTRRNSRDFVARSAASRPKQLPLRGLTFSTLEFMRSTRDKSTKPVVIVTASIAVIIKTC